jgi:SAM-dependent methyltransferase
MNTSVSQGSAPCVVCGSSDTTVIAEVRGVPVHTTVLWRSRAEAQEAAKGDIDLTFCRSCGHMFNPLFDAGRTEYTQAYENSLHFSPLFQKYAEGLADRLVTRYGLQGKDVLEIGSGKGDFLALMVQRGAGHAIGYDPSFVPGTAHQELIDTGRMAVVREFFDPDVAPREADLMVCRQVLEHIEQPLPFLGGIRRGIPPGRGTVLFFEVPNALSPLRDMDVWTLIYEHCGFYTPQSLGRLFRLSGFEVLSLDELYEGIFLGIEARPADAAPGGGLAGEAKTANSRAGGDDVRDDDRGMADLLALVEKFRQRFDQKVAHWRTTLRNLQDAGKRVVIWGGGARGVTFLNLVDTGRTVQYVVDINPRKAGTFVAGTGQQVVLPSALRAYRPDVVVLMNPIYRQEIAASLRDLGLSPDLANA